MTDITYGTGAVSATQPKRSATLTNLAGAAVSLALVVGVGVWGYKLLVRDVSGIPVVQAMEGPMRVAPEDPGGRLADHQGLAVNRVVGAGGTEPPAERLVLAPRPAGLASEDVALGAITPMRSDAPRQVTLEPAPDLAAPVAQAPILPVPEADPIQALADQIAAGAEPLSELAPGEDAPVITEVLDPPQEQVALAQPAGIKPGPGLPRSLRPKLRPARAAATSGGTADAVTAAVVAANTTQEIAPDTLPEGTRLVQIGAYDSPDVARSEWARLEERFGDYMIGKQRVIQRASSGGRVFYRLRAHGFEDIADARRFCAAFVAQKVDCIPVVTR